MFEQRYLSINKSCGSFRTAMYDSIRDLIYEKYQTINIGVSANIRRTGLSDIDGQLNFKE